MVSLAEQFLDDLEEDVEEEEQQQDRENAAGDKMEVDGGAEGEPGGAVDEADEGGDDDDALLDKERLKYLIGKIGGRDDSDEIAVDMDASTDEGKEMVLECVRLAGMIDEEIFRLFQKLREGYSSKFPELETLIYNPLDYARVVSKVQNETDLTKIDLASVLPSATVITVTVTASATSGKPLGDSALATVLEIAQEILHLDEQKGELLKHVESQTSKLSPNVSALVGSSVAARLIGIAGSITQLASIPACNVQVLGGKKRRRSASDRFSNPNEGVIFECELVKNVSPDLRQRTSRVLCSKCVLAARVDAVHSAADGSIGRKYREELEKKIEKWGEPPPAKTAKPLPIPDERPGKKRGGRRHRKTKELYAMTDMRKQQNRMAFGKAEAEIGNRGEAGLGMLGAEGSKRVRIQAKKTDSVAKAANRKLSKIQNKGGSGARAAGLTTSLTFIDQQGGFELGAKTPMPGGSVSGFDAKDGTKSNYFSSATPFLGSDSRKK